MINTVSLAGKTPIESLRIQLDLTRQCRVGMIKGSDMEEQFRFFGMEDLVLKHRHVFATGNLPRNHRLRDVKRACFYNCYQAAHRHNSPWIYCEGFALIGRLKCFVAHHAWLTRADSPGIAFDPTWTGSFSIHDMASATYMGIPFRRQYILQLHRKAQNEFCVLDAAYNRHALLRGVERLEDVIAPILGRTCLSV